MTHRKQYLVAAGLLVAGLVSLGGMKIALADSERADCPGKVVCPLTGELVCRDQCPTIDPDRPDCPGRIICPLTGDLVCRDRCPLGKRADGEEEAAKAGSCGDGNGDDLPSCCRSKG